MKNIFKDILSRKAVEGLFFFSNNGKILFMNTSSSDTDINLFNQPDPEALIPIIQNVKTAKETELCFENRNIYLRFIKNGIIMILLSKNSNSAMIRLLTESIISQLEQIKEPKGLRKLFKRKTN